MKTRPDRCDFENLPADWLDGNLSPEQEELFQAFLKRNPGLAETLPALKLVNLKPPEVTFAGKGSLKRSPDSISEEQFVTLCIASLENDLAAAQQEELDQIVSNDENKRAALELIKRLKVRPRPAVFRRKSAVKKLTAGQRIFRYSLAGLSMAATVALLIMVRLFVDPSAKVTESHISHPFAAGSGISGPHERVPAEKSSIAGSQLPQVPEAGPEMPGDKTAQIKPPGGRMAQGATVESTDSIPVSRHAPPAVLAVRMPEIPVAEPDPDPFILRKFNPRNMIPEDAKHRSNVDRFIARLFHGVIMNDTLSGDRPVKSFDLAIAGITGINKLLGWDMTLDKITDEKGELRSYYFASGLLKFNAPAKKP